MIDVIVGLIVAVLSLMLLAAVLNVVLGLLADWLSQYF